MLNSSKLLNFHEHEMNCQLAKEKKIKAFEKEKLKKTKLADWCGVMFSEANLINYYFWANYTNFDIK